MEGLTIFDTPAYQLYFEAVRADIEDDLGFVLTEEVLSEERGDKLGFTDRMRWSSCKASLKFLADDTLDAIIEARYSDGAERINQSRKQKVKMVKEIADELPRATKWKIIHGQSAELMDMKAKPAHIASATGLGAAAISGAVMAAMGICSITAAPILGAIGLGGLACHGIAAAIARAKHKKANMLRKDQIARILLNDLDLDNKYTHNQDGTITYGGMLRKLKESYVAKPEDELLYFHNGFALVEDAPMHVRNVSAEEFVIKNIRQKILSEAAPQYDPVEILRAMGVGAIRPYNGMPLNKFIIANLIPGPDMDAIMGETGDYGILISACLGDDDIQTTFKEIKKELKNEPPNENALIKLKDDMQQRIYAIAQRLAPKSEQIAESAEMMEESFLGVAGAIALGTFVGVGITKAIGALARWIKNRKQDKKYAREQKNAAARGENYVEINNGGDGLTINIGDSMPSSKTVRTPYNPYKRDADDPEMPKYRSGKKVDINKFLKQLEPLYKIIDETEEGILLDLGKGEVKAITLYDPDEIRGTYFEYTFEKGVNQYYQIGEDDMGDIVAFCPQAADNLYIVNVEDILSVDQIDGLKYFRLCGGGLEPGYAIGSIKELKFKSASMYDPALDKDVDVKIV